MGLVMCDSTEIKQIVLQKLSNSWILVLGHRKGIEKLENLVYTPGTAKSNDFELYMMGGLPLLYFFLVKKTKELKEFLSNNLNDYEFDCLVEIEFYKFSESIYPVHCLFIKEEYNRREQVEKVINELLGDL